MFYQKLYQTKFVYLIETNNLKIRPQAKIDNFAFKNSNIIIEGLI